MITGGVIISVAVEVRAEFVAIATFPEEFFLEISFYFCCFN